MPIREIFNFIRERRDKFSREEIIEQLLLKGYDQNEIEQAFFLDGNRGVEKLEFGRDKVEPDKALPKNLWEAIKEGQTRVETEPAPASPWVDWDKVWRVTVAVGGLIVAPVLYYFGVLLLFYLQLFWPVPEVDSLFIAAGAVLISGAIGFFTSQKSTAFSRGIFWGTTITFLWGGATLAARYSNEILLFLPRP